MKYKILRIIDVAGLQVLDPVVRLLYREDPPTQLKRIGQFIVVPALTFAVFLGLWSYFGPRHTTKSGEVPSPGVVWAAAEGVLTFHEREKIKSVDLVRGGEEREVELAAVEERLAEIAPLAALAGTRVAEVEKEARAHLASSTGKINESYREKRLEFRDAAKSREATLTALASRVASGDASAREQLLDAVAAHRLTTARETGEIQRLRDERTRIENAKYPPLLEARRASNALEEELQFLRKRRDFLTSENRTVKSIEVRATLDRLVSDLAAAPDAPTALAHANAIVQQRESLTTLESAGYSKPWTLPAQIGRSLRCVFTGFFVATLMAVPLGILCGLSRIFMAAMTPLISLFKPVSPIVWLPIVFIIVGGFIPNPADSPILRALNRLPFFAGMDINPAFLASALTVALCSLWPTLVNTALGVASIDKDHLNVARVLRLGVVTRLSKIVIPSALPLIFAGLRISLGVGWMVLIAAELLSSSEGIGKFVWDMFNNGSSQTFAQMFVVVFVVGAIGLALDRMMIVFQRLVSFDGAPTAL